MPKSLVRTTALSLALAATPALAAAQLSLVGQSVNATADIFAAGLATVPSFPGGGGSLPLFVDLGGGLAGRSLSFANVTGSTRCAVPNGFSGPDGSSACTSITDITGYGGISGIRAFGRTSFLVGLFLDANAPSGATALTYGGPSGLSYDLASYAPTLGQLFFVGDGLTAGGATQQFVVPTAATRLYVGFVDGWAVQGAPGYFGDNSGRIVLDLAVASPMTATPEPATLALVGGGLLLVGAAARRRRVRTA
jgi:hypothetical protein